MPVFKPLTNLSLSDLWKEVKISEEEIWGDLNQEQKLFLKHTLEKTMRIELSGYLKVCDYQRSDQRTGHRNGYYTRSLETPYGLISSLSVPRSRDGRFRTAVFAAYERRKQAVSDLIKGMFLSGVSTRKVGALLETILGYGVSAQTVSRILRSLDGEVNKFHRRALSDDYQYLFLDGVVLKHKSVTGAKKRLLLAAYGIRYDGKRELLDYLAASSESQLNWEAFLNHLNARGLKGDRLKLIVTDGCPGLEAAVTLVYPQVKRQRCWAHKLRNVANYLPKTRQEEVISEAGIIYRAANKRTAVKCYWNWAGKWRDLFPKAVNCLEKDLDGLLTFLEFPQAHHSGIRTTNAIERAFREVRRRTRPIGCFNDPNSIERIAYGIFFNLNKQWKDKPAKKFTQDY